MNIKNGKLYVGSTRNLQSRKSWHFKALEHNRHHSILLQRAYNKYGKEAFEFDVLQIVEKLEDLIFYEQKWIDLTRASEPNFGYNILQNACYGSTGRTMSLKERQKRSKIRKNWINLHPEWKQKLSDHQKQKGITVNFYSVRKDRFTFPYQKLQYDDVVKIKQLLREGNSHRNIGDMFNVSGSIISLISTGKRWKEVV